MTPQATTQAAKRQRFDPWFGLSLGMVLISGAGLFYMFVYH